MISWMLRLPATRTDVEKWKVRPHLNPHNGVFSQRVVGRNGAMPCFFLAPKTAVDQPAASGTIGDCLELVPDGRKLNIFEVDLWTGDLVPVVTDDYVPGTMPLAFTRVVDPVNDWARGFHVFLRHVYDPYMTGSRFPFTYVDCYCPITRTSTIREYRMVPGMPTRSMNLGFFSVFGWSRIQLERIWLGCGSPERDDLSFA